MSDRRTYTGPALLSAGFRPFFLLASLFGATAIALWLAVWDGALSITSVFAPVDWHVHEMIFGYGAAVVAGFLFTAVPNWTGRLPTRGWPLATLALVWIAGRLAVAGLLGLGPVAALVVDQLFLLLVGAMIAREIVAGRNWRNLKVLIPVTLFWVANIAFHVEALRTGVALTGHRAGIAILIFLIMLIGGRILPSFTRNWLVKAGHADRPVPFGRFDGFAIFTGVAALVFWVGAASGLTAALVMLMAAALHVARLLRWRGWLTWRSPLLLMLHVAYAFIPAGFTVAALSAVGAATPAATAHVLAIGAVASMTVAVMIRATLGHTGRPLEAGPFLTAAFAALVIATGLRVAAEVMPGLHGAFVNMAGTLWVAAYLGLSGGLIVPVVMPKPDARRPSGG
ncbi:short-chain dehydrogenase [Maritimibacter sp. DP07]|uniref:Short-chain dehydrogenase n=1 Tax=Maritimibacter harenae TaxID=2606218 RepID=A0A845LWA4_9RHOB|nr:NnrS family protein [Maritimibacter harenae]MZR11626.1 short-chain dehydrogenase [Maritimibacter harenae]